MSTLLTLTTQPLSLADAVESLLKPLRVIHVPVTELALVLQIALRFVPTLMDQTTKIMNAQRARGVDFGEGNIFQPVGIKAATIEPSIGSYVIISVTGLLRAVCLF